MNYECQHCGCDYALHHFKTMQCPKGGEALPGRKQEWLETTFLPDNSDRDNLIESLLQRIENLEKKTESLQNKFYRHCNCEGAHGI